MLDLSIVIVSYNNHEVLSKCLTSITESTIDKSQIELLIVDNYSTDRSVDIAKSFIAANPGIRTKLITNKINVGFGAANNIAMRLAKGNYVLLLNSDVILDEDTLQSQLQFMKEHQEYAVSTCRLVLANGHMDPACHRGFPTPWASVTYLSKLERMFPRSRLFGRYHQGWSDTTLVHDVDAISGGFFMVKKDVLQRVGLFDEGFFMYGEDLDLCLRIRDAGYRIGFNPGCKALHLKGRSGRKKDDGAHNTKIIRSSSYHFWNSMKLFYKKHYETRYSPLVRYLVYKALDYKIKTYDQN